MIQCKAQPLSLPTQCAVKFVPTLTSWMSCGLEWRRQKKCQRFSKLTAMQWRAGSSLLSAVMTVFLLIFHLTVCLSHSAACHQSYVTAQRGCNGSHHWAPVKETESDEKREGSRREDDSMCVKDRQLFVSKERGHEWRREGKAIHSAGVYTWLHW